MEKTLQIIWFIIPLVVACKFFIILFCSMIFTCLDMSEFIHNNIC